MNGSTVCNKHDLTIILVKIMKVGKEELEMEARKPSKEGKGIYALQLPKMNANIRDCKQALIK